MTGLCVEHGQVESSPAEAARAEVRRLTARRAELPELMREAAAGGRFEAVAKLRLEWERLPIQLWAARYTAVHSELAAWDVRDRGNRDRHGLLEQATQLAQELHSR
jgi:hypothetical protein